MKRSVCLFTWFLVAVMSVAAAAGPADGKKKKRRAPRKQKQVQALRGSYAAIAKEIGLTEEQMKKLAAAIKAKDAALKSWRQDPAKGGKLAELSKKMRSPEVKADKQKRKELMAAMKPLADELKAAEAKLTKEAMAVLTPEQQKRWKDAAFYVSTTGRMRRAELTDEQKAKARTLCAAASKKLTALGPKDRKQRNQITKELRTSIQALLTPAQQEKLKPKPKADRPKVDRKKRTRKKKD